MKALPSVLALVPDAYGGRGGIAQYNRDFLSALAETRAVSSITILPRHAPDLPVPPPELIEQMPPKAGRVAYSVGAARIAMFREVDIVFCGHLFMAPLAAAIARFKAAKLIVQTHGIEAWPKPTWHRRKALEGADVVLCVSRHTRATVLGWAAMAPERVLVVPNTVREVFTPGDGSTLRVKLGLENKRVLLTVGRMDSGQRYKGHDRVIRIIPDLVKNGCDICYLVVGHGDDRPRLEAFARSVGVSDRVRFLGAVELQRLVEICRMVDLFVMPSAGEGFGIAFLEAMACGTPALGLGVAGDRDALADGELGTIASEAELPATILRILNGPRVDRGTLAAAARYRFGRYQFVSNVHKALNRLEESLLA